MFRHKRNFSILVSQNGKPSTSPGLMQASPSKRLRLSSSFRNSTLLTDNLPASAAVPQNSPILQRFDETRKLPGDRLNNVGLAKSDPNLLTSSCRETVVKPLLGPGAPLPNTERPAESAIALETSVSEVLKLKDTPPPTPLGRFESRIEVLSREKGDIEMEIRKLEAELEAKFESIRKNKDSYHELKQKSYLWEDYIEISLKSFCEVRNILNQIYNPGLEVAKNCESLLEESRRRHSTRLQKLTFELNQRVETSTDAIEAKEKQLEHEIELHQRTLLALENQEKERALLKQAEVVESKLREVEETRQPMESATVLAEKADTTEDDCVIINCEYPRVDETNEVSASAKTPDIQELEVSNHEWVMNQSEIIGTCEDEEETDIEESKDDEDEGSFTPQQAQRV